jgi:hypothetical protein
MQKLTKNTVSIPIGGFGVLLDY